jgi:hypothetical protein
MSKDPRSVLFISMFVLLLFWSHSNSFLLEDENTDLNQILENCAQYCDKLSNSALYFVCTEKVEETIRKPQESASNTFRTSGGITYTVYGGVQTQRHTYVYDYQLVRKNGIIKESRILLKENGKKKHKENALLKTERFYYKHVIFGPTGLLSRKAQLKNDFKIIKYGKFNKEKVVVIRATPKNEREVSHLYGDVWVSRDDFRILKIEWNQQSLQDYEKMEKIAEQSNAVPQTILISEYGYEHNGIQFPSKYTIKEIYESKTWKKRRNKKSETIVTYKDYKFFTVEVEIK